MRVVKYYRYIRDCRAVVIAIATVTQIYIYLEKDRQNESEPRIRRIFLFLHFSIDRKTGDKEKRIKIHLFSYSFPGLSSFLGLACSFFLIPSRQVHYETKKKYGDTTTVQS